MKKIFLREVFWLILTSVLSLIVSFLFMEFVELSSAERGMKSIEKVFSVQLYIVGTIVSFICIYIIRIIVYAIKTIFS
jgi:hypothetical protein|tara:strand:+ start:6250 stop:6483 length:234 start_codon:yes stop_codon:yes gene_type:complete